MTRIKDMRAAPQTVSSGSSCWQNLSLRLKASLYIVNKTVFIAVADIYIVEYSSGIHTTVVIHLVYSTMESIVGYIWNKNSSVV